MPPDSFSYANSSFGLRLEGNGSADCGALTFFHSGRASIWATVPDTPAKATCESAGTVASVCTARHTSRGLISW